MLLVLARNVSPAVDGKPAPISDYDVSIAVNSRTIWRGTVKGHRRKEGWRSLLRAISAAPGAAIDDPYVDAETSAERAASADKGVVSHRPIRAGETVCEHGLRPFECWSCRSCHPVD